MGWLIIQLILAFEMYKSKDIIKPFRCRLRHKEQLSAPK